MRVRDLCAQVFVLLLKLEAHKPPQVRFALGVRTHSRTHLRHNSLEADIRTLTLAYTPLPRPPASCWFALKWATIFHSLLGSRSCPGCEDPKSCGGACSHSSAPPGVFRSAVAARAAPARQYSSRRSRSPLAVDCMHPILRPVIHWPQILPNGPYVCVDGGVDDIMYMYMHMPTKVNHAPVSNLTFYVYA